MIAIKGYEMPKNCIECVMQFGGWCGVSPPEIDERVAPTVPDAVKQGKPKWCPLVEIDAQPVKQGHWSECYRDSRCISVICSVCKNPTAIAHGCRDADEVTMDYVIERLPYCPKCRSDMRGDAKNGNAV